MIQTGHHTPPSTDLVGAFAALLAMGLGAFGIMAMFWALSSTSDWLYNLFIGVAS